MQAAIFEAELELAAEMLGAQGETRLLRGQAGRYPARRLESTLRRQGFIVTGHFLDRLRERAQTRGIRFDPKSFARDFANARHFRQTREGYNTRIARMHGLPVLYRVGGRKGQNIVLVGLLPQDANPPAEPIRGPNFGYWREQEHFERELAAAANAESELATTL